MIDQPGAHAPSLDVLPATGYVRQSTVIGRPARKPTETIPARAAVPGIVPFSSATLWRKVKDGTFPAPVKLSEGVTAWAVESLRDWMQSHSPRQSAGAK